MGKFQSSKVFDGFSTVFRQWKADTTHCKYVHGYGISFKIYFEGDLDERNWVWDFGGMKRAKGKIDGKSPNDWFDYMFDHSLILAEDAVRRGDLPEGDYIISYHGKSKSANDWGMTYPESLNKPYGRNSIYISRVDGTKVFKSAKGNSSNHVSIFTEFPILKDHYAYGNTH